MFDRRSSFCETLIRLLDLNQVLEKKDHLPLLTSLRGLAAVIVVLYHLKHQFPVLFDVVGEYTGIFKQGYLWVDFFFILSGFILSHVYGKKFMGWCKKHDYGRFMVARFARIYPLHLFVLMLYLMMEFSKYASNVETLENPIFNEQTRSASGFVASLFLVQAAHLFDHAVWNASSWSISAEWFAYLLFPLMARVALNINGKLCVAIIVLCIAGLGGLISLKGDLNIVSDYAVPRSWMGCLIGVCLYRIYELYPLAKFKSGGVTWCALVLSLACMNLPRWWGYELMSVGSLAILVLTASKCGSNIFFLASRPMMYLGEISYSIYLTHGFLLIALYNFQRRVMGISDGGASMTIGESLVWTIGVLGVSIGTSAITYPFVEVTGRDYLRDKMSGLFKAKDKTTVNANIEAKKVA